MINYSGKQGFWKQKSPGMIRSHALFFQSYFRW